MTGLFKIQTIVQQQACVFRVHTKENQFGIPSVRAPHGGQDQSSALGGPSQQCWRPGMSEGLSVAREDWTVNTTVMKVTIHMAAGRTAKSRERNQQLGSSCYTQTTG